MCFSSSEFAPFSDGALWNAEAIAIYDDAAALHAQRYMFKLLEHIQTGELSPEVIITHHPPLEEAARGYEIFEKREEECRKVVLTPGRDAVATTLN